MVAALAVFVDELGQHFLAAAGLARNEDGGIGAGDLAGLLLELLEDGAGADDDDAGELFFKLGILLAEFAQLECFGLPAHPKLADGLQENPVVSGEILLIVRPDNDDERTWPGGGSRQGERTNQVVELAYASLMPGNVLAGDGGRFARFLEMLGQKSRQLYRRFAAIFSHHRLQLRASRKEVDFPGLQRLQQKVQATLSESSLFNTLSDPEADMVKGGKLPLGTRLRQPRTQVDGLFELEGGRQTGVARSGGGFSRGGGGQLGQKIADPQRGFG